jgi:hypothetical protein
LDKSDLPQDKQQSGQCSCGFIRFSITGPALLRAYCHCTICQEFNQVPFADVTAFRAKDVVIADESDIVYKSYKKGSGIQRGKCKMCDKPAIEQFSLPLLPKLTIIPSENINNAEFLPDPVCHIFYDSHIVDIDDELPKYHGFIKSQLTFTRRLLSALFKNNKESK